METIINVDDVSFAYGTQAEQALSHVSLSVNKEDFIGIIGPSGAGKSTLPACLSGAVPHHYTGTFFGSSETVSSLDVHPVKPMHRHIRAMPKILFTFISISFEYYIEISPL